MFEENPYFDLRICGNTGNLAGKIMNNLSAGILFYRQELIEILCSNVHFVNTGRIVFTSYYWDNVVFTL